MALWPETVPFPLQDGGLSPALDEIVGGPAAALTAVALVAGPQARASGWAAAAAVALARRWLGPRRVLLADVDLEQPRLHELLGLTNDVGLVDLIDYGLSPRRCTQAADGGTFDLLAAGGYALEPGDVLRDAGWTRLLVDVAARRATVLALVPSEADGVADVVARAGAVLVLADESEAHSVVETLSHPYSVLVVLVPAVEPAVGTAAAAAEPAAAEAEAAPTEADATPTAADATPTAADAAPTAAERSSDAEFERIRLPTDSAARETLIADLRDRQRAARQVPPADSPLVPEPEDVEVPAAAITMPGGAGEAAVTMRVESAGDDVSLETIDPGPRQAPPARRAGWRPGRPLAWTLAVVLLVSLLGGAWRYLANRLSVRSGAAIGEEAEPAPPLPAPVQVPAETPLPFAVAVEAHRDVVTAVARVNELSAAEPTIEFHVAPLERDGVMFYHVMAGPLPDSAGAVALRDTLIARRHRTAPMPTDVRATPLAFLIGDYSSRELAEQQLSELIRLDLPGYMILADAADGEPLYRVYIGGFASDAEADVVRQLLRAAGIRDSLVTRTGSITP